MKSLISFSNHLPFTLVLSFSLHGQVELYEFMFTLFFKFTNHACVILVLLPCSISNVPRSFFLFLRVYLFIFLYQYT
jgi:hypothetical protein